MKKTLKMILFLMIGFMLFNVIQKVLISDANLASYALATSDVLRKEDVNVDILFVGPSHTANGISPMQIYERSGIVSCNLGTGKQPLAASYYIMKDVYAKHDLKAVVLDASALFYENGGDNEAWRDVLDNMDFSRVKMDFIRDYGRLKDGSGWVTAVFPMIQYHSRWNQIGEHDFHKGQDQSFLISHGVTSKVMGTGVSLDLIAENEKRVHKAVKYTVSIADSGEVVELEEESNLFPEVVSEDAVQYLKKIKTFCDENGIKLILTKIPSMTTFTTMGGSWTIAKSKMVKEVAEQDDIIYIDCVYDNDIGINWLEDTADYGAHLNIRGAIKVSNWFADYLSNNQQIGAQSNQFFDEQLVKYQKWKTAALLQSEQNLVSYFQRLLDGRSEWIVMMAVCDDGVGGLTEADYEMFNQMKQPLIRNAKMWDSYVAIIDAGRLKYEAFSDESITYHYYDSNGHKIDIYSSGSTEIPRASISIDGREYAKSVSGINIVVYDKKTQLVIDSVTFHTNTGERNADREWGLENTFLVKYRQSL